jgi:hypothetical protein
MFRGEYLARLKGYKFEQPDKLIDIQMFVDQKEVVGLKRDPKRNQPESAWVRVTVAGEEKGLQRVILPQPAQPVGEGMLVDATELREKAPGQRNDPLRSWD